VIRLYRVSLSTNVERVALALAHKGLAVESVEVDYDDRTEVRRVSGQDRVPVIDDDGRILSDSTTIIRELERRYPEPPLFPVATARRAETDLFLEWFDNVWKRQLLRGLIDQLLIADDPDEGRVASLRAGMRASHDLLERLLTGRDYLMGDFSAADCVAFPFVKFARLWEDGDEYETHKLLRDEQQFGSAHPNVAAWIDRVDERPRV
jgi:glutathione S-transferase